MAFLLKQVIEKNIAETQVEIIASCWVRAEEGFDGPIESAMPAAAKNATDLLTVREAMEVRDELVARHEQRRQAWGSKGGGE